MGTLLNAATRAAALAAAVAIAFPAPPAAAQAPATPDTARLRQSLAWALGGDFRIVRHELSSGIPERGGTFWLVHVAPARSGNFHFQYRYPYVDRAHPNDPLYTHVQHESYLRVGERGCRRRQEARDACLGDTLILPFVVNGTAAHTFSLAYRGPIEPSRLRPGPLPRQPAADGVRNPVAEHLEYLGMDTDVMLHRSLGSTTVYRATFEAKAPGRFNLRVQTSDPGPTPPAASAGDVPVIIVEPGRPVTRLLEGESVTQVHESRGFSSHSGNQYLTTPLLLQPGDRVTLEFGRVSVRGRDPAPGRQPPTPVIVRLPFAVDREARFNAWIADRLPRDHAR